MARPCLRSDLVKKAGRSQRGLRHSQWDMFVGTERPEREPVTSVVESGEKVSARTASACPSSLCSCLCAFASKMEMVPSAAPHATITGTASTTAAVKASSLVTSVLVEAARCYAILVTGVSWVTDEKDVSRVGGRWSDAVRSVEDSKKKLEDAFEEAKRKAKENPDDRPTNPFDNLFN